MPTFSVNQLPPSSLSEALNSPGWSADKVLSIGISVLKGRASKNPHMLRPYPSYAVELVMDGEVRKTETERSKNGNIPPRSNNTFTFCTLEPGTLISTVKVRAYCNHRLPVRKNHVIGEASFDAFEVERCKDFEIALYSTAYPTQKTVAGYITLHVEFTEDTVFMNGNVGMVIH